MGSERIDIDRVLRTTFVARAEYHPTLTSTNDRAAQCAADASQPLPLLILADRQTAGRGRGGNRWWTGPGSLAFSLLLAPDQVAVRGKGFSPLVGLAAALAVVDTVAPLLPGQTVGIHWPNDVMAAGRKLSGVLVEVLPDRKHVIGIGLNTNNSLADAPPELQQTATTLRDITGAPHDQTEILVTLLSHLQETLGQLAAEPGAIGVRADALCLQRGKMLSLELGSRLICGRCAGIAPNGGLRLETPTGVQEFFSGVVRP